MGRNLSDGLTIAPVKTYRVRHGKRDVFEMDVTEQNVRFPWRTLYYTPQFCRILKDQPPYHDSFLLYDLPENW